MVIAIYYDIHQLFVTNENTKVVIAAPTSFCADEVQ